MERANVLLTIFDILGFLNLIIRNIYFLTSIFLEFIHERSVLFQVIENISVIFCNSLEISLEKIDWYNLRNFYLLA